MSMTKKQFHDEMEQFHDETGNGLGWADWIDELHDRVAYLEAALKASMGYLMNARIDLETGAPKATAIRTIEGGIKHAETALITSAQKRA